MKIKTINAHGENVTLSVKRQLATAVETLAEIARQQRSVAPEITRASLARHIAKTQPVTEQTASYYLTLLDY